MFQVLLGDFVVFVEGLTLVVSPCTGDNIVPILLLCLLVLVSLLGVLFPAPQNSRCLCVCGGCDLCVFWGRAVNVSNVTR